MLPRVSCCHVDRLFDLELNVFLMFFSDFLTINFCSEQTLPKQPSNNKITASTLHIHMETTLPLVDFFLVTFLLGYCMREHNVESPNIVCLYEAAVIFNGVNQGRILCFQRNTFITLIDGDFVVYCEKVFAILRESDISWYRGSARDCFKPQGLNMRPVYNVTRRDDQHHW